MLHCNTVQRTATKRNTSQHSATQRNTIIVDWPCTLTFGVGRMLCTRDTPLKIHTATHCNILQHTVTHCNILQHTLQRTATHWCVFPAGCSALEMNLSRCTLWHTATHCNTLQHAATHCHALQHTATHSNTHCNALQHADTHCQHDALRSRYTSQDTFVTPCNTLQRVATHCNALQHTATRCNTLQRTATHCNTLVHRVGRMLCSRDILSRYTP